MIKRRFASNGYPVSVLRKCERRARFPPPMKDTKKRVFLALPFMSEQQARDIRGTVRKCGLQDHIAINFYSRTLSQVLKPRYAKNCPKVNCAFCEAGDETDCWIKECVYRIDCRHCDSFYVGETKRTIRSRLREHLTSDTSLVHEHLLRHTAVPSLSDIHWCLLHRGLGGWQLRRRVELSAIQKLNPDINIQRCSNPF